MEEITEDVIDAIIEKQDLELERWLGRLVLLSQTTKGRETIQTLLTELNSLIESMTDEAQRHMGGAAAPAASPRVGGTLSVHKQIAPQGADRETAQAAVLAEFTRYVLASPADTDPPEEAGQRKLVVALSLWPELSARLGQWDEQE